MRNPIQGRVIGVPVNPILEVGSLSSKSNLFLSCQPNRVILGATILDTIKGKLSLGAMILQAGGIERVFSRLFTTVEGERLQQASQCYLSTSVGPIAGILFICNVKVALHSDRHIRISSANGDVVRVPYKVVIPMDKIERVNSNEDMYKPKQKYINISTVDDFEFWFMGFFRYQRTFRYLQMAVVKLPRNFLR